MRDEEASASLQRSASFGVLLEGGVEEAQLPLLRTG